MNTSKPFNALILCLATFYVSSLQAREYAIEVLIFAHVEGLHQTQEQFPINQKIISPDNGLVINNRFPSNPITSSTSNQITDQWRAVPAAEFILTKQANLLQRSSKYRVLQHLAWIQPMVDKNNTLAVRINGGRDLSTEHPERLPAEAVQNQRLSDLWGDLFEPASQAQLYELEGTISVAITRYIHVYTNLVLRAKDYHVTTSEHGTHVEDQLQDYQIDLYRKMKSRELHYIDHPLIGVLIEATPIEMQEQNPQ